MLSFGDEIAASLSSKLGWPLIVREKILAEFFNEIANDYERRMLSESCKYFLNETGGGVTYLEHVRRKLFDMAEEAPFIIMGFGSQMMFADEPEALHFRIVASDAARIKRARKLYNVSDGEAELIIKKSDKKRRKLVHTLYGADLADTNLYHAVFNTTLFSVEECVSGIMSIYNERTERLERQREDMGTKIINNASEVPVLKTESEKEFARILDMYQIDWQYEPKTFPIEWDDEGNITSAFSPDFYLTNFDTYIELTTMDQKYVTEKNKKVKKLKKLYPGTNIRIVYKKDFHTLVERFKMGEGE
jgi:cytidylate kinase